MKKSLLFSGLMAAAVIPASAADFQAPVSLPNISFQAVSPNGRWAASSLYGTVTIFDLTADDLIESAWEYIGDDYGNETYTEGLGNYVSNTGIVLGGIASEKNACYWENGEWHTLSIPELHGQLSYSSGITPDGARIVGCVGLQPFGQDDNQMLAPAYWDRQADGSYGEYHVLPHPDRDFTGRVPQYVTAISVSDDGKTIGGMITDCRGFVQEPIVYTQNADGEWSYNLIARKFVNPDNVVFPEYPGDGPRQPSAEELFSDEEKAAYDAAVQAYYDSGYSLPYPDAKDYLSDEKKATFEESMAEFNAVYQEWLGKYTEYEDLFYSVFDKAVNCVQNLLVISPDGRYIMSTREQEIENPDPMGWMPFIQVYNPVALNVETGELSKFDEQDFDLNVLQIPNNNQALVASPLGGLTSTAGIINLADGSYTPLEDYLKGWAPELSTWFDENIVQELETGWDEENECSIYSNVAYMGHPHASSDLSIITLWNDCPWDYENYAQAYVFDAKKQQAGIAAPEAAAAGATVAFDAVGNLLVEGNVETLTVYDLSGRCVLTLNAPAGTVANNLASGVYVAKATTPAGAFSVKLAK